MSKMSSCSRSMRAWAHPSPSLTVSLQTEATATSFLILERDMQLHMTSVNEHQTCHEVQKGNCRGEKKRRKQHKNTLSEQNRSEEQSEDADPDIHWQLLPSSIYPLRALWQLLLK